MGLAVLLVACAAGLRVWPLGHLGANKAWLTFYPAVMLAAAFGGLAGGLLATGLSCLTVLVLWPWLMGQAYLQDPLDLLALVVFALTGAVFAGVAEARRGARSQALQSASALAEREAFLRAITDALPGMVGYWDRDLRCRFANQAYVTWFGKAPEAIVGHTMQELMGERLFALNEPFVRGALRGERQEFERTLTKADSSIGFTLANYIPDFDGEGRCVGFFVLVSDVTSLKEAENKLELAATVFRNSIEGILVTDAKEVIVSVNPAFTEITGYPAEEALGKTPRILKSGHHDRPFYAALWRDLETKGRWQGEIWNRRKGGEAYLEWLTIVRIDGLPGAEARYLSVFHDITEMRHEDHQVRHLAFHDALTGLPNRALLMNRLEQLTARAGREHSGLGVMFLDLDGFKQVNDLLGHGAGDELLRTVGQRILAQVRQSDTVARLGGDEFVLLLDNPAGEHEVAEIAGRVLASINEPLALRGGTAAVGASIGIAMFPAAGRTPADLVRNADRAMSAAKQGGKNGYRFFPGGGAAEGEGPA